MTSIQNTDINPEMLTQKLNDCYERLEQLVGSSDPNTGEAIYQTVMEAEQLVAGLTEVSQRQGTDLNRAELSRLNEKVASLIVGLKQQMLNSKDRLMKVKKGQTAVKGYRPIQVGMGFTEGKFFDSKK